MSSNFLQTKPTQNLYDTDLFILSMNDDDSDENADMAFSHSIHTIKAFEKLARILSKGAMRSSTSLKISLFFVNLLSKICSKKTRNEQFLILTTSSFA